MICIGALALLLFALALYAYSVAFGSRCDKNPLLKYFTAEDFSLTVKKVEAGKGRQTLCGGIYTKDGVEKRRTLVIFCHGLGAGHAAYMTEINYFCEMGYTVLALDSRGCHLSGGRSIKGMYSGVVTAKAAIDFARSQEQFAGFKICLVGHSWGGYSVLCASAERKVDGVVALSAPSSPVATIYCGAKSVIPAFLAALLCPFIWLIDLFNFGLKSNKSAPVCAKRSGVPVLLIHGDRDDVVPIGKSAYAKAEGENIVKYLASGKSHNPYNTPAAQEMMIELSQKLAAARKMSEEEKQYFKEFDFAAATQEDNEVMGAIYDFIEKL